MNPAIPSVVFDCMIYAQAMISGAGSAAACFEQVRSHGLRLVWSDYVLQEVRELPPKLPPRLKLTPQRVEAFIDEIAPLAIQVTLIADLFANPFDPDDSHYVNLALAAGADIITSRDADLLNLMDDKRPEGREFQLRFPQLRILPPEQLLEMLRRPDR